jgi:hypothetical protein
MSRKNGADRLVEELTGDCPVVDEGRQLALEDQLDMFSGAISPPAKPRGRPKGAISRTTKEWARRIIAAGASPLEFWARVILREPAKMAEEWGIPMPEVLEKKMEAAKMLAPYVHKRMPLEVDVGEELRHLLVFGQVSRDESGLVVDAEVIDVDEKGQINQSLASRDNGKSEGGKSDEEASQ